VENLVLYMPAEFRNGSFVSNPRLKFDPGKTTTTYHVEFSRTCGIDSLGEIESAIRKGARAEVFEGFHRRNSEVASNCTHMLAFTFGSRSGTYEPSQEEFRDARKAGLKDGGTAHTWGEAWKPKSKRHVNLFSLA